MNRILYLLYLTISRGNYLSKRRVTPSGFLFLSFLCLSAAIGLDTSRTMVFQLFTLLLGLGCLALCFCVRFHPLVQVRRKLPRLSTAGEPFFYRIMVENKGKKSQTNLFLFDDIGFVYPTFKEFCTWRDAEYLQTGRFERLMKSFKWQQLMQKKCTAKPGSMEIPDLPVNIPQEIQLQCTPLRRGLLRFPTVTFGRSDPFGLFRALHPVVSPDTIVVLPKRYPLPELQLAGSRKYQPSGVTLASSVGDSQEFMSLRDYRPGDPPRIIHWKSWAKLGKPVVKEYQDEYFSRHALVLDTFLFSASERCFEESVSVAASLACTVANQDSLLDLLFINRESYCFTAGRGVGHTGQLMEILASVQPSLSGTFDGLSKLVVQRVGLISSCIFVFLHWDQGRRDLVKLLAGRGIPVLALIISEDEQDTVAGKNKGTGSGAVVHWLHPDRIAKGLARI